MYLPGNIISGYRIFLRCEIDHQKKGKLDQCKITGYTVNDNIP